MFIVTRWTNNKKHRHSSSKTIPKEDIDRQGIITCEGEEEALRTAKSLLKGNPHATYLIFSLAYSLKSKEAPIEITNVVDGTIL